MITPSRGGRDATLRLGIPARADAALDQSCHADSKPALSPCGQSYADSGPRFARDAHTDQKKWRTRRRWGDPFAGRGRTLRRL